MSIDPFGDSIPSFMEIVGSGPGHDLDSLSSSSQDDMELDATRDMTGRIVSTRGDESSRRLSSVGDSEADEAAVEEGLEAASPSEDERIDLSEVQPDSRDLSMGGGSLGAGEQPSFGEASASMRSADRSVDQPEPDVAAEDDEEEEGESDEEVDPDATLGPAEREAAQMALLKRRVAKRRKSRCVGAPRRDPARC
jgi:hypothetical protein